MMNEVVEHVVFAIGRAGDAAEVIGIGGEDGFGGFPDGLAVFVEGEFIEDEVAGETASGARICSEDFDASDEAIDGDAGFEVQALEGLVGAEVDLFEGAFGGMADFGAFGVEFDAVGAGI